MIKLWDLVMGGPLSSGHQRESRSRPPGSALMPGRHDQEYSTIYMIRASQRQGEQA